MKNSCLSLVFALLFSLPLTAQMEVGQWAPPFTLTGLDGNQYRLYDYLAAGKPVIIDLAAAWCPPCWDEHESGVLKEIWDTYGPNGADEVMVFFIEADPGTNYNQLIGIEGPSMGNWVAGTPYPIIDVPDYGISFAYRLQAYPTILLICPDMRVKVPQMWAGLSSWTVDNIMAQLTACDGATPPDNDASVFTYDFYGSDCYEGNISFGLFNSGANPLSAAEILLKRDEEVVATLNWSGELAFGQEEILQFANVPLDAGENQFFVELANNDDENANNTIGVPFLKAPQSSRNLTVYVQADDLTEADNTRWFIEDDNGIIVAESGPLANNEYSETPLTLEVDGCYTIVMADDGGDGLINGGFILISDDNDNVVFEGGQFGIRDEIRSLFLVQATSRTQELSEVGALSVFPNPALGQLTVKLELTQSSNISLEWVTVLGESLSAQPFGQVNAGRHQLELGLAGLQPGIYYLLVHSDTGTVARKVVKL